MRHTQAVLLHPNWLLTVPRLGTNLCSNLSRDGSAFSKTLWAGQVKYVVSSSSSHSSSSSAGNLRTQFKALAPTKYVVCPPLRVLNFGKIATKNLSFNLPPFHCLFVYSTLAINQAASLLHSK